MQFWTPNLVNSDPQNAILDPPWAIQTPRMQFWTPRNPPGDTPPRDPPETPFGVIFDGFSSKNSKKLIFFDFFELFWSKIAKSDPFTAPGPPPGAAPGPPLPNRI